MKSPDGYPEYGRAPEAVLDLLLNREAEEQRSGLTPPSRNKWYHGRAFLWDHLKHVIMFAREGSPESLSAAETEFIKVYEGQADSGMVPNQVHLYGKRTFEAKATGAKGHSFYGQPPMGGIGGLELHHALEKHSPEAASSFLNLMYAKLKKEALYWPVYRKNGREDFRIGVISGEETGMDESPIFDHQLPIKRLHRNGIATPPATNMANMAIHFAGRMWLDRRRKGLEDNEEGLRKAKEIFWVMPVQMQALVTANLYAMSKLAQKLGDKEKDSQAFAKFAVNIESQVLSDITDPVSPGMWDQAARNGRGMFRDLDRHGRPINAEWRNGDTTEETTVSNLMALLFPNLKEHQLTSLVDMALEEFMDEYGLGTVGKVSPNYDPKHSEKDTGRWRGPSWLDQPWFLAEALVVHINREDISTGAKAKCQQLLNQLCETSVKSLDKWKAEGTATPEYYSHLTGQAFRLYRVAWFAWNKLGYFMPPGLDPSVFGEALLTHATADEEEPEPLAA